MRETGEDTNVVVRKMLEKRRRTRVPIIIGGVVAVVFITYMVIAFGPQNRGELTVEGPVYPGKSIITKPSDGDQPPRARSAPANAGKTAGKTADKGADEGKVGVVQIVLAGKDPQLWVDGKSMPAKADQTLVLSVGKHTVRVQQGNRTLMQNLALEAGERYLVRADAEITITQIK